MIGDTAPKRYRLVIDALAVLTFLSLSLTSYLFYDRITASRETQSSTKAAIRTVLCFAQQNAETDPQVSPSERRRAVRFYTEALVKIDALPCHPLTKGDNP